MEVIVLVNTADDDLIGHLAHLTDGGKPAHIRAGRAVFPVECLNRVVHILFHYEVFAVMDVQHIKPCAILDVLQQRAVVLMAQLFAQLFAQQVSRAELR